MALKPSGSEYAKHLQASAACRLGRLLEKQGKHELALAVYRCGQSGECNERLIRLLYSIGLVDEAKASLESIIDDPSSDEEYIFAADFYSKKFSKQRIGSCTDLLRQSTTLILDEAYRGQPEEGAASAFRRQGWTVYWSENILWQTLFGLLFWEELFERGSLQTEFDWIPQSLKNKSFSEKFDEAITSKLNLVSQGQALSMALRAIAENWDRPNGIFSWAWADMDMLRDFLDNANAGAVARVLRLMADDYMSVHDGFPDLLLVKDGIVRFEEVKAEGDVIRRNQLTRLRQLQKCGFEAEICRVQYDFNPYQDYVVVDIETTGGFAYDRITEIGAVKIRNHQVVGEWHSLINPQRSIPAKITQLTGITNSMVANAPLFGEISDGLSDFLKGSVFVAHSVNFDYGFLSREYRKLDKKFSYPKFCTCAGMRRHFPGHSSYGLGNLCHTYSIELENHHRALCDAKAAAELLNMINRKRCGFTDLKQAA